METNLNIIRLLEMLDNPDAYSEQEIRDIINKDDETREAYHIMVAAKQGYHSKKEETIDVDKTWEKLKASPHPSPVGREKAHQNVSRLWIKIAASIIGILFTGAIAYAACVKLGIVTSPLIAEQRRPSWPSATEKAANPLRTTTRVAHATKLDNDTIKTEAVIYDNIPLEKMLSEIVAFYGFEVTFKNDEARQLRFHFVWNRNERIDKVVENLNHFESLNVTLQNKQLIVE